MTDFFKNAMTVVHDLVQGYWEGTGFSSEHANKCEGR